MSLVVVTSNSVVRQPAYTNGFPKLWNLKKFHATDFLLTSSTYLQLQQNRNRTAVLSDLQMALKFNFFSHERLPFCFKMKIVGSIFLQWFMLSTHLRITIDSCVDVLSSSLENSFHVEHYNSYMPSLSKDK